MIFQESDVIFRSVRDYLKSSLNEIIVDTPQAYDQVVKYVKQLRPEFADRIKLYQDKTSLFARNRLECQIETAYQREVNLKSGASIVFDQGEALTAIDINSKKATAGSDIEETAFNINIEAAEEILFNCNDMAKVCTYFNLGSFAISPDNTKIALVFRLYYLI